jgi:hypothetical protein
MAHSDTGRGARSATPKIAAASIPCSFTALLAGIALVNRREARKLQAEIDELDG